MFENLKSILTRIMFLILFLVLAKSCVTDYINGGDKETIENLKQMIDEKTSVTANLSDQYTETKIAGVVKYYKFDYSFYLNDKEYFGKISLSELPNSNEINLYYLKNNPEIVVFDPQKDLKVEQEKGKSITELLVGILWAILAVLVLISLIRFFVKKPKVSLKEKQNKGDEVDFSNSNFTSLKSDTNINNIIEEDNIENNKEDKEDHSRFMPK